MIPGDLWRSDMDGKPVWLLDWPIHAERRRNVSLIVDMSDSCAGLERERERAFNRIVTIIGADACEIWVMGTRQPKHVGQLSHRPPLEPVRTGSWITDTLRKLADREIGANQRRFVVVVTDGEIFDADEVQWPAGVGIVPIGKFDSARMTNVAYTDLTDEQAMRDFFVCRPADVLLNLGWSGGTAVRCDKDGHEVLGEAHLVEEGQSRIRVVMSGGSQPQPVLTYVTDGQSLPIGEPRLKSIGTDELDEAKCQPWVKEALRRLSTRFEWNREALQRLSDQPAGAFLECAKCQGQCPASRSLFCHRCGDLLVARPGIKQRHVPVELGNFARTRLVLDKATKIDAQRSETQTRDAAYEHFTEAGGIKWLLLKLRP